MRGARRLLLLLAAMAVPAGGASAPGPGRAVAPRAPGNPRNSEADLVLLPGGRLLLAWSEFYGGAEDDAAARIAARLSPDRGRTWGPRFVLQENMGSRNVMSVSLLRRKSGEVLLFFLRKDSSSSCIPWMRRRGGATAAGGPDRSPEVEESGLWSPPEPLPVLPGYHVVNNARAIETSRGRLLVPAAHTADIEQDYQGQKVRVYWSDDGGRTWKESRRPLALPGSPAMEPGVVELGDGTLFMVIRTRLGRIWRSRSRDGGLSWEEPASTALRSPTSPATVARIPSTGDLLLIWNDQADPRAEGARARTPLAAALSRDGGETWSEPRKIEDDPAASFAYTSITFLDEQVLLTYYREEAPRYDATDLILRELPLGWFYGKE